MTQDPADTPPPSDGARSEIPPGLQAVPALSSNGRTDAKPLTAAQQTAEGVTALTQMFPQAVAALTQLFAQFPQAFADVLAQVPVRVIPQVRHLCAPCVIARVTWELAHAPELKQAETAARAQLELGENDPFPPGFDPALFLPDHLRPGAGSQGMPVPRPAITTAGGTEVCAQHIPGLPGKSSLVVAQGALSPSLLAQFAA